MIRGHDRSIVVRLVFDEPSQLRIERWQLGRKHPPRVYGIRRPLTASSLWRAMRVNVAKAMKAA